MDDADIQTAGIGKGTPGPGRPKGSQNKSTKAAKELIQAVADGLGGADRMLAWAQEAPENERAFWTSIYPKLLPVQLQGDKENPLEAAVKVTVEYVNAGA